MRLCNASIANKYEFTPNPVIIPLATGEIYDLWRKLSLAYTLVICISILGPLNIFKASNMPTEV